MSGGYRDHGASVHARVVELRSELAACTNERDALESDLALAIAEAPETNDEELSHLSRRLRWSTVPALACGLFVGAALVEHGLGQRIAFGFLAAFVIFVIVMSLAIGAAPPRRTKREREALLATRRHGKLGALDVDVTVARIAELQRLRVDLEGELADATAVLEADDEDAAESRRDSER